MGKAGKQAQALTSDNVILDFSGLFSSEPIEKEPAQNTAEPLLIGGQYQTITESEKPADGLKTGIERSQTQTPAKALIMQSQREDEDRKRTLEVYKTYQENIQKSGQLQTDILKGIKAGEDIYRLFLKAVEAIGCMTSNKAFYTQIEADIKSIYGAGLQEPTALMLEHEEKPIEKEKTYECFTLNDNELKKLFRQIFTIASKYRKVPLNSNDDYWENIGEDIAKTAEEWTFNDNKTGELVIHPLFFHLTIGIMNGYEDIWKFRKKSSDC